ncbi:MAG: hypothetical protein AB7Y46_02075 [Armatimonadota bacterium]
MPREVMERRAGDNVYLHRDFHGALSTGLIYLEQRFGEAAVREFLRGFARRFYAPLRAELSERGLAAIADRLRRVYELEGGKLQIELSDDELLARVEACPAVTHMRAQGYPVSRLWRETITAVNEAIVEGSAFDFDLVDYDERSGRSVQRFYRRTDARPARGGQEETPA